MQVARNVAIIFALAAAVTWLPGGGNASAGVQQVLVIAMLASVAYFAVKLYREHRVDLYSLGDRNRTILYASVATATLTLTATDRLWATGAGSIVWLALMALAVYAVYFVFRAWRQY
ncbi:MAG TPA: hypothetical protein VE972_10790 [Conexibacter sp.]|nr:hypothetical protein [Conexibacter sp.]